MRRYRRFRFFLLALSILISLNVACMFPAYYEEVDLKVRKHFSEAAAENLLTFIKKDPWVLHSPGLSVQYHVISLPEVLFSRPDFSLPQDSKTSVLRC